MYESPPPGCDKCCFRHLESHCPMVKTLVPKEEDMESVSIKEGEDATRNKISSSAKKEGRKPE